MNRAHLLHRQIDPAEYAARDAFAPSTDERTFGYAHDGDYVIVGDRLEFRPTRHVRILSRGDRLTRAAGIILAMFLVLYFAWQFAGRPGL